MSNAGDGLFLKADAPAGTVVAFYNGIRIPAHCDDDDVGDEDEDWEQCDYRVFVDTKSEERMDIPAEYRSWDAYRVTSGHKVNHSFTPNCDFGTFFHPRFGRIPCIKTLQELKGGTELFCYYYYALSDCPEWYSALWDKMGERK